ncbi:hypothetical protein RA178_12315 [Shewanella oncorhynchi]|uniref:Uncharacterized protein n=1 Tax=Shewanella oncorhynchi TaxID=2726434 RepID=A0AA50Q4M1_9GAMM|nr:hypothetical protein [Shewanella oncorhynchi]WMB71226.1 hypothetical protein RA178_12315 [Shewanella oncorhynchi]
MNKHLLIVGRSVFYCLVGLYLLSPLWRSAVAATITIGKGSGIVWEGMPYTATNNVTTVASDLYTFDSLAFVVPMALQAGVSCLPEGALKTIAGYKVYQIAPGVGMIPRATISANYVLNNGMSEQLSGTIGLPATQAVTTSGEVITNPLNGSTWCLAPRMLSSASFYKAGTYINATMTGTWVIIADGSQTSQVFTVPNVNFITSGNSSSNRSYTVILPASTEIRISTLECNVSTTQIIDFGVVTRNTQQNAELGSLSYPLTTQCTQDNSARVAANINVQFRALTGLYEGITTRLALSEGGGILPVRLIIMLPEVAVVMLLLECHLIVLS